MVVLDTNVISELMRSQPDERVLAWTGAQDRRQLYTTAITVAEIHYGIQRLPKGRRQSLLAAAAEDVFGAFGQQVLPFDHAAGLQYGRLVARLEQSGRPINAFDAQIAAICTSMQAALASRNARDFDDTGVEVVNPWD